jgi:hypothetical protein
MKRGEEIIGGQHWQQDMKCMTAVNHIIDGMPNSRTSAILFAAAEVVTWVHPMETTSPKGKRISPRIIVYPADMPQIEEELHEFNSDPSERPEGKYLAYAQVCEKFANFTSTPHFIREDSEEIRNDSVLAAVPELLTLAAQVSIGGRNRVLGEGPNVSNSSDEDSPEEERGEVLTGMYTGDLKAPIILSQPDAARLRAAGHQLHQMGYGKWIDSDPPHPLP